MMMPMLEMEDHPNMMTGSTENRKAMIAHVSITVLSFGCGALTANKAAVPMSITTVKRAAGSGPKFA